MHGGPVYLITGASGYVGSRLVQHLASRPGTLKLLSRSGKAWVPDAPEATIEQISDNTKCRENWPGMLLGVDAVVHLAADADATNSFQNRESLWDFNHNYTLCLAQGCAETNVPLIHLSSTTVYGSTREGIREDDMAEVLPHSPYAMCKRREEQQLEQLRTTRGLRYTVLRCGSMFGLAPSMRFHTAIHKFCRQAALGHPITVWNTAMDQVRPYLCNEDTVQAISLFLEKKRFEGETFNAASDHLPVRDILEIIRETEPRLEVQLVDHPIMNNYSYTVSCDRLKALGFAPQGTVSSHVPGIIRHQLNKQRA